jgi:hypothetical protein
VQRIKPAAVALGSSRVEVGLDPRHAGWADGNAFNFGLPSATSYEMMLGFLHAQAVGRPLRQAVAGLDFFGFNIFFSRQKDHLEFRFAGSGVERFADFLSTEFVSRAPDSSNWDEELYLALNPDVAAAIARKEFKSGREHWKLAGRAERRESGWVPNSWNEAQYIRLYPDVASEVRRGAFLSGYHHYRANGQSEGRNDGTSPDSWNEAVSVIVKPHLQSETWDEALYLALNPDVAAAIARKEFKSGRQHWELAGQAERRESGWVPRDWNEAQYIKMYPDVAAEVRRGAFLSGYHHYRANGRSEGRKRDTPHEGTWSEALYLALNPDVAAAIALK